MRAVYRWYRALGVVCIEDADEVGAASVTNDVERVLADLEHLGVDLNAQPIVYRDSMGYWDQIVVRGGRFFAFQTLRSSRTLEGAISHLPAPLVIKGQP